MNETKAQKINKITTKMRHCIALLHKLSAPIQIALWNRINILLLAAGLIYWTFMPFFEQLFSHYWVTPFLSYFQSGIFTQIIAGLVLLGIFIQCGIACKNRKRISEVRLYRWILITAIWSIVRFSETWSFVPLIGHITYFDLIPCYTLSVWIAYAGQFIKRKPFALPEIEGFICDEPIETSQEDSLKRSEFAQILAQRLLNTQSKHQSFAMGILSSWGFGKTSFLNLIKEELKRYGTICIDFSPWIYGKDHNLIQEFFSEIGKHLQKYADTLPRDMMEYAQILEKSESTSWLSVLLSLGNSGKNLKQQSLLLKQSLQKVNLPIVVFIDDLDRLGGNEIMEVLKLIRNAANFPEIKFIAAYDRAYLVEAIKQQNIVSANYYLEKIFQVEYTLPAFNRSELISYLDDECGMFISEEDNNTLKDILYSPENTEKIAIEELLTLRDVKRYVNALKNSYEKLAGNVVLSDLMNLDILKLKYKPVYELLGRQWRQTLIKEHETLKLYKNQHNPAPETIYPQHQGIPVYKINDLLEIIGYNPLEISRINRILELLFPSKSNSSDYGAINHLHTIERYFYGTLQNKELPIKKFRELWLNNNEECEDSNDYKNIQKECDKIMARDQTSSLVNQLNNFSPDSPEVCKKVIRIMFYVGSSDSSSKCSYHAIMNNINQLNHQIENKEVKIFLINLIKENGLSDYMSEFLYSKYHSLEKYFPYEEIKEYETRYLQEAIHRNLPLDAIYKYMDRAIHKDDVFEQNEEAVLSFKKYVQQHTEEFLISIIKKDFLYTNDYGVKDFVHQIWGSWEKFRKYVESIPNKTPAVNEFETFLNKFIEQGAQKTILYTFKEIPIK